MKKRHGVFEANRLIAVLAGCVGLSLSACTENNHYVIASTGTVIGVEVSQNPATQTPQAKLGYNRAELAIVPSNRTTCAIKDDKSAVVCGSAIGNAQETPDVLMELKYSGIFDLGQASGIYQRLAVRRTAVSQPGAAFMFAKDASGTLTSTGIQAVSQTLIEEKKILIAARREKIDVILAKVKNAADAEKLDVAAMQSLIDRARLDPTKPEVGALTRFVRLENLASYLEVRPGAELVDALFAAAQ